MKRFMIKAIACVLIAVGIMCTPAINSIKIFAAEQTENNTVDLVFSTDLHSYLSSYSEIVDGKVVNVGGVPRISTYINDMRAQYPDMLLLDAGDYPMGTLYQTLFAEEAFEYRMLSHLGYDAITFGNHDFDYGSEALSQQFETAAQHCDYYPYFPICNVNWDSDNEGSKLIYNSVKDMNLCDYAIIERDGMRIGVTAALGYDAIACAPTCELDFKDPIESVKETVARMKAEENPDMIVMISHCGTNYDVEKSEDHIIAKEVPDIDFIVSGHSHIVLPEIIKVGDTYIGSPGCYGEYMGHAQLKKNDRGRYDLVDYTLTMMDESIAEDEEVKELLSEFKEKVDMDFLGVYGYKADQVVGNNKYDFSTVDDLYYVHDDHNLGEFIADAYRWQAENIDTGDDNPVSVTVAPAGTIRATYPKGDINIAKVYESFSLGSGLDGSVGYPLISLYLTGEELITACEIDASVSELMNSATLYLSGLEFTFNPHRLLLNRVVDAKLRTTIDGTDYEEIDPNKLYRVVTDLYSYRMLGAVKDTSKGLLVLEPKNKNGEPITDESDFVLKDRNGNELKAWVAIAEYMQSLDEDGDGVGDFPAMYDGSEDRKIIDDSKNLINLVKSPNKIFFAVVAIVIVVAVIIVLLIILVVKIIKWIKKRSKGRDNN